MTTVQDIYNVLFAAAPEYMKMEGDNVGLICGRANREVTRVMIALDASHEAIHEAKDEGCELLVTHHPLIFNPIRRVSDQAFGGDDILFLIENQIAAINLHTNLDCAPEGVNQVLAETLGLQDITILGPNGVDEQGREYGLIHMGTVPESDADTFARAVKAMLGCEGVRYADAGVPVRKVAVGGGSCGSEIDRVAASDCDTFVTADLKYHNFQDAKTLGLNLIDAGHFHTENPVCACLARLLGENFPELRVMQSKRHKDATKFA